MKRYVLGLMMTLVLLISGSSSAYTTAQFNYWHYIMSQTQRNNAILNAGIASYNGSRYDTSLCNCYTWANGILSTASSTVMAIPPLTSNGSAWQTNSPYSPWIQQWHFTTIPGTVPAISTAYPGHIVQMLTLYSNGTWGPHTAIVHSVDSTSVTFLNAHYSSCGIQLTRMTWDYFNSHVSKYTINVIN